MNKKLIESMELVAQDTRKEFSYNKGTGLWAWRNRDLDEEWYDGFPTRLDALKDAVEPYMDAYK